MTAVVFGGSSKMKLNQKGAYMAFRKGLKGPDKKGHRILQMTCYPLKVYK